MPANALQNCPMPENEERRVAALHAYRLLDTQPEPEFDVTTRVAARLFDVPIALVALMDTDRLWFKSRHGLDVQQLDREIAFCAHAIVKPDELMVIEDLALDPRFVGNPLVHDGPRLRFYAGAPLVDAEGHALGTIAVLGLQPRAFGAEQRALLKDLAVSVMTAIDSLRRGLMLRELATTDSLTGLANRIRFHAAVDRRLSAAREAGPAGAAPSRQVALLYTDLDGFKDINDAHGHAVGDRVLQEVAQRMRSRMRAEDTLARLGGDEFAAVIGGDATREDAIALAERLVEAVGTRVAVDGIEARVGVSIGIVVADAGNGELNAARLGERADHALYRAKLQRVQRWCLVDGDAVDEPAASLVARRVVPVAALQRRAQDAAPEPAAEPACGDCAGGIRQPFPFTMAFQPIVDVEARRVHAYEALVRGVNREGARDVLSRVTRRNRYAFDQSCRVKAIELACALGILEGDAHLSINFIPGAMYEPANCVRATLAAARRAGFPPDRLIMEVTESEEVADPEHLAEIFRVYRASGFHPAIDDFGAGYAGLNQLARFQPDLLKIDRDLLVDIDASRPKRSIVRGVLEVCRDLGITPLAEGVETMAEYAVLRDMGLRLFQGYLFARPEFEALPVPVWPEP
jgi:diguanylate cyclase (GGDEF)-like protein